MKAAKGWCNDCQEEHDLKYCDQKSNKKGKYHLCPICWRKLLKTYDEPMAKITLAPPTLLDAVSALGVKALGWGQIK